MLYSNRCRIVARLWKQDRLPNKGEQTGHSPRPRSANANRGRLKSGRISRTFDLDRVAPAIDQARQWICILCVMTMCFTVVQTLVCVDSILLIVQDGRTVETTAAAAHELLLAVSATISCYSLLQCIRRTRPFYRTGQAVTLVPALEAIAQCWRRLVLVLSAVAVFYAGMIVVR